ncbi:hypothetical protein PG996_004981 [Apiospora saccharicola]|uniref:Nephrocystin 3-like N-terminal domain-containing protein n=1 Tax=Apiospora saccharicola TaxID=335842 RepID=A0ABR1VK99_9PEZI
MTQQAKEDKRPERGNRLHPALVETHDLDFSIDKTLLDAVLNDERFREWQSSNDKWQLRFSGSPGCGKTTLSSIIVEKLRKTVPRVASIYLQQDVASDEAAFVEKFLWIVYAQLDNRVPDALSTPGKEEDYQAGYAKFIAAREQGLHQITNFSRSALQSIVPNIPRPAFLVVDGIDRCSPNTSVQIEKEISQLQHYGVKIMTTSRVPWIGESWPAAQCDGQACSAKDPRPWIHVYWACEDCMGHEDKESRGTTVFLSISNNTTRFKQPFDRMDFDISKIPDHAMINFVRRAIQQENGDVGFGSLLTSEDHEGSLPSFSSSSLGIQMLRSHNGMAERVVREIAGKAQGNMALAHKRLELFHRARFVDAFLAPRDRLPASIVEMFDAALRAVEAQGRRESTLGLQAIAAVGRSDGGVPFADFQGLARHRGEGDQNEEVDVSKYDGRIEEFSLLDVLYATKGLVVVHNDRRRGPRLVAFHPDFYLYCGQGYRESIMQAHSSLKDDP